GGRGNCYTNSKMRELHTLVVCECLRAALAKERKPTMWFLKGRPSGRADASRGECLQKARHRPSIERLEDRTLLNRVRAANLTAVAARYQALLSRPVVDPVGLATWPAALERGLSTQDVALRIANSTEARTKQVQSLYGQYLHRQADPVGLNAFSTALA